MKQFIYLAIFLSGLCSLGYQAIWQRYLGVLVGSESRSITLIISVFLLGLSIGYYYFGKLSTKFTSRNQATKFYGYIELATAMYALLFSKVFTLFLNSSLSGVNNLFLHFLITCLLILLPTFLMGATIPIMTLALPESEKDVNSTHSRIYGINTIGAFFGVLVTSLLLVPSLGLEISLKLLGSINLLLAIIYLVNNLKGQITDKKEIESLNLTVSSKALMALAFVMGMASISLEVLWIRVLSMTIGTSYVVFPIILSIFIFSIGYGSLKLKAITARDFYRKLYLIVILSCLSFLTIPYLPLFISNVRVLFVTHEVTFYVFHIVVYSILFIILFPSIFFMGQMLPYCYSFLNKNKDDYAYKCGQMYFVNTIGTIVGAILFGYLFFVFFNFKVVYMSVLWAVGLIVLYFFKEVRHTKGFLLVAISLIVTTLIPFSRKHHVVGQYRKRNIEKIHFKNIFKIVNTPFNTARITFVDDGPNTTVSVIEEVEDKSKSFFVNAKSDGNTNDDLGTMGLAAVLPYVATKAQNIDTAVIGIGTGLTAGVLTMLERVKTLDVIEISKAAINSVESLSPENFDFHKNSKTKMYEMDAFQFFKSREKKYDVIASEPSNVWVTGVENLYTNYFYQTAANKLKKDGVFAQWFHYYSMNDEIFVTILKNLKSSFNYVELYRTTQGDTIALASQSPLKINTDDKNDVFLMSFLKKLNINSINMLNTIRVFNNKEVSFIIKNKPSFVHDIFEPHIGHRAYKSFYLGQQVILAPLLDPYFARLLQSEEDIFKDELDIRNIVKINCATGKAERTFDVSCLLVKNPVVSFVQLYQGNDIVNRIEGYSILRKEKYLRKDVKFLKDMERFLFNRELNPVQALKLGNDLVNEYQKEGMYDEASALVKKMLSEKMINIQHSLQFTNFIELRREKAKQVIGKY
ncbi:MAG: hypothetical protein GY909_11880 [Oligoflexia bacterium]|nr:hypothetical protein [Oligoflexia bacterium]